MKVEIINNMDKALLVMQDAGKWLKESGKNPSIWWHPKNMNNKFMKEYANPHEFFVAIIEGEPAAAMILQEDQRNQSWESVDIKKSPQALYIHWLCVKRSFAGKNMPKYMIEFASSYARKKGINILRADTNDSESKLKKIYSNLGFEQVGILKEEYRNTAFFQKKVE